MWLKNDNLVFLLTDTYRIVFGNIQHRVFQDNYEFIHGIIQEEGTFSASIGKNKITAHIYFANHVHYETILFPLYSFLTLFISMSRINTTERYYLKEWELSKKIKQTVVKQIFVPLSPPTFAIPNLRILVMYTKEAVEDCFGGEECILSLIALAIGNYNLALKNSLVNMTVSYVAERIGNYDTYREPGDMGTILGQMGNVISTQRRNVLNCHAVHITVKNTLYCGIASYSFNGITNGYSVTHYGCMGGYMSLAHEIGHNIGLQHDHSGYGGGTFNRGYCWDDSTGKSNCRRSIMAYSTCKTPSGKTNCDRVAFFSTPNVVNMGNAVGSPDANNAQQIRNNIWTFMNQFSSQFIGTITPCTSPTPSPTFLPSLNPTWQPSKTPSFNPTTWQPSLNPTTWQPSDTTLYPTSKTLTTWQPSDTTLYPTSKTPTTLYPTMYPVALYPTAIPSSLCPSPSPSPNPLFSDTNPTGYSVVIGVSSTLFCLFFGSSLLLLLYKWRKQNQIKQWNFNRKMVTEKNVQQSKLQQLQQLQQSYQLQQRYKLQQRYQIYSKCIKEESPDFGETV